MLHHHRFDNTETILSYCVGDEFGDGIEGSEVFSVILF